MALRATAAAAEVEGPPVPAQLLVDHHILLPAIRAEKLLLEVSDKFLIYSDNFIMKLFNILVINATPASAKKRNAPNAPNNSQTPQSQPVYGTLPHSVGRYQQNFDLSDVYNTNSTLPHPARNSMIEHQRQNNNNVAANNNINKNPSQQQHFDNKVYERFEPYMMQSKTSHKRSPSSDSISRSINLGEEMRLIFEFSERFDKRFL